MIENSRGLSQAQVDKIRKPFAHNSEARIPYKAVTKELENDSDANVWSDVSKLLSCAQK